MAKTLILWNLRIYVFWSPFEGLVFMFLELHFIISRIFNVLSKIQFARNLKKYPLHCGFQPHSQNQLFGPKKQSLYNILLNHSGFFGGPPIHNFQNPTPLPPWNLTWIITQNVWKEIHIPNHHVLISMWNFRGVYIPQKKASNNTAISNLHPRSKNTTTQPWHLIIRVLMKNQPSLIVKGGWWFP